MWAPLRVSRIDPRCGLQIGLVGSIITNQRRSAIRAGSEGRWLREELYQPSNCLTDDCPIARRDGGDSPGLVEELLPGFLTGIEKVGIALEDAVGEIGLAQVLPDVLDRIELGRIGRQFEQADVAPTSNRPNAPCQLRIVWLVVSHKRRR